MKGTLEDWTKLIEKTEHSKVFFEPMLNELELSDCFTSKIATLKRLLDTVLLFLNQID